MATYGCTVAWEHNLAGNGNAWTGIVIGSWASDAKHLTAGMNHLASDWCQVVADLTKLSAWSMCAWISEARVALYRVCSVDLGVLMLLQSYMMWSLWCKDA